MNGTNGIWASVCAEGAAMGHTSSCSTVVHLARLGNKRVLQKFNCQYLRQAAINATRLTTGREPHAKQLIYGKRALDLVLEKGNDKFDVAAFFGEEMPMRICTVSSITIHDLYAADKLLRPRRTVHRRNGIKNVGSHVG